MAISIGSDEVVTLTGLLDNVTGSYQNAATVNGYLYDSAGTQVTTFTLSYVAASTGNYRGTLTSAVTSLLTVGNEYKIKVSATQGGFVLELWEVHLAELTAG